MKLYYFTDSRTLFPARDEVDKHGLMDSFRRQLLQQSSITYDICTVA